MSALRVNGGTPLYGNILVGGSKNASLPILFSALVTRGVSRISRVPDISDVRVALKIIEGYGAKIRREGDTLYIDTRELAFYEPDRRLVSKIRGSTYILGASLGRFGKCAVSDFGGCNFTNRPIDLHIFAAERFGGSENGGAISVKRLAPANILFPKRSVGATANAMILAAAAEGESIIRGHAREPHISALADFLRSAGAEISMTESEIRISGGGLHGGNTEIIGDMIEAGSYLAAGIVTGGRVGVFGCDISEMGAFLEFLASVGANIEIKDGTIYAERGRGSAFASVSAEPYPAYPTDLQPIAAPILASLSGGRIFDRVFDGRFGYLEGLRAFSVRFEKINGGAEIFPSEFHPSNTELPDLRGGMACLIAALAAKGESRLANAEMLMRGYEKLQEKITSVGGSICFE